MRSLRALAARVWAPMPPERLAVVRILVGVYIAVTSVVLVPALLKSARLGAAGFHPVMPLVWLSTPPPPVAAVVLALATSAAGVLLALGVRHAVSGPLAALLFLLTSALRNSWGMVFHTENLLVVHAAALAISPAADALSWDARRRARAGFPPPVARDVHGWSVRLLCALTVAAYFVAGVAKLRFGGAAWATGEFLRDQIAYDNLRKAELGSIYSPVGAALCRHAVLFAPLSLLTLALELGGPLSLLHRRAGRVWALGVVGFHLGIVLLMAVAFPYPMTGAAFAAFFNSERAVAWLGARRARVNAAAAARTTPPAP